MQRGSLWARGERFARVRLSFVVSIDMLTELDLLLGPPASHRV